LPLIRSGVRVHSRHLDIGRHSGWNLGLRVQLSSSVDDALPIGKLTTASIMAMQASKENDPGLLRIIIKQLPL
jgi:hypothetical protein